MAMWYIILFKIKYSEKIKTIGKKKVYNVKIKFSSECSVLKILAYFNIVNKIDFLTTWEILLNDIKNFFTIFLRNRKFWDDPFCEVKWYECKSPILDYNCATSNSFEIFLFSHAMRYSRLVGFPNNRAPSTMRIVQGVGKGTCRRRKRR